MSVKAWMSAHMCGFCCRYLSYLPRTPDAVSIHCQPLPANAFHGVDVDITFHYVSSHLSTSAGSAIALALPEGLGVACSRWQNHTVQQVHQALVAVGAASGGRWQ